MSRLNLYQGCHFDAIRNITVKLESKYFDQARWIPYKPIGVKMFKSRRQLGPTFVSDGFSVPERVYKLRGVVHLFNLMLTFINVYKRE